MFEFLSHYFSNKSFIPHGHCYLWKPPLVWLQVVSNSLIGLSYVAISATLAILVYKIRDIPFQKMYFAFGIFIISCGFTHLLDVVTVWDPIYWTDGFLRGITAIASVGTAILLPSLVPKAVALAQGAKAAHDRGIKLETAYQQLGKVFEKTKELDELKTQFFANVSHELRTPLALIIGPAERMKSASSLTHEQRRDLEIMLKNAKILLKHVNDLLDVAKLEAGKLKPSYIQTDLAGQIRLVGGNFDGLARERNIQFSIQSPDVLQVQMDSDMIQRVVLNLLSNAFKFVPNGGKIQVSAQKRDHSVRVIVQDNGPGVPNHLREAIFDRFRQADIGSARQYGGTGLGLSIAKEFVDLHHGKIWVSETLGGGATFTFEIPVEAPAGVEVGQSARYPNQSFVSQNTVEELRRFSRDPNVSDSALKKEKGLVLVVEDNPDMNQFVSETLSSEYRVERAFDGKEGLEKAQRIRPDLIVSDIMMPVMSGDQMVEEIKNRKELFGIPIILVTAKADDELRNKLLRERAQDYVTKPFSTDELLARVRNLVTMKRARDAIQKELESQLQDLEVLANELSRKKRDLQDTAEKFRIAKEEAERASRAKSTFLGLVSHEMKTPMTTLKLQLDMLKRSEGKSLSTRQKEMIDRLERSSERSIRLMDTLLEFTKLQSEKIEPRVEAIPLLTLVEEIAESIRVEAQEKNLELKINRPQKELPYLQSDKILVQMIVRNLLGNAIKHTDSGSVEVTVGYENHQHTISVKDTGPGIPEEYQSIIFEPFKQVTPLEKKNKPGFGLGLSIVKESVQSLGGRILLSSKVGKGSTFTAQIPDISKAG